MTNAIVVAGTEFVAPDGRTVEAGDAAPAEEGEALVASRAVDAAITRMVDDDGSSASDSSDRSNAWEPTIRSKISLGA